MDLPVVAPELRRKVRFLPPIPVKYAWARRLMRTVMTRMPAARLPGVTLELPSGDIDLFHEEDQDYAERLRAAGVQTTFHVVPNAPHGFEAWASGTDIARDYLTTARTWLRQVLDPAQ